MGGKHIAKSKNKMSKEVPASDYAVERIVDDRIIKGKAQYKVHWEGYESEDDTWENESQLNCPELLEEYIAIKQNDEETTSKIDSKIEKAKSSRSSKAPVEVVPPKTPEEEPQEYEVEKIVDDREVNGKTQYKVHWVGYTTDEETWEDETKIDCPDLLKKYLKSKGSVKHQSDENSKKPPKKKLKAERETESGPSVTGDYEVEKILEMHTLKNGSRQFLVKWVGYSRDASTWEPEENLNCTDILKRFLDRVDKAKELETKELRVNRRPTDRFTAMSQGDKRRQSKRYQNKQRVKYYDAE